MIDLVLTRTKLIMDADGPSRIGGTIARKRFIWRGPKADPVFCFENVRNASVERVDVVLENPCEAVFLSERTSVAPSTKTSTGHRFTDVRIFGNGITDRGVYAFVNIDENNELFRFDGVFQYGVKQPWVFDGVQSKHHLFTHCGAESYDVAVTASTAFHWIGGTLSVGRIAFVLSRAGDPVVIESVGVEATGRLLETSGPRTDAQAVSLLGVRFAADQLHPDGAMIVMRHAGPLTILGGSFGDGAQPVPVIECAGIGEQSVTVIGAKRGSYDSVAVPFIRTKPGVRLALTELGITHERAASATEHTATRMVG